MYRAYSISVGRIENFLYELDQSFGISRKNLCNYIRICENSSHSICEKINSDISDFLNVEGRIDVNKLEKECFPQFDADIFISHSHVDRKIVSFLAGWLEKECGLKVFVDYTVWEHYDKVLELCNKNKRHDNPEDFKKNLENIHLIVNAALMKMIDQSNLFLFLNSDSSNNNHINSYDVIKPCSPWIYSELLYAKYLRKKLNNCIVRKGALHEGYEYQYEVYKDGMVDIYFSDLVEIKNSLSDKNPKDFVNKILDYSNILDLRNKCINCLP